MLTGQAADAHCGLSFCQYGKFNKFYARILYILSIVSIPKLWYYNNIKRESKQTDGTQIIEKNKKPIDKPKRVCYNKYIIKERLWYYEVYH